MIDPLSVVLPVVPGKPGMAGRVLRPQYSLAVAGVLAEWLESSYVVSSLLPSIRVVTTGALQKGGLSRCPRSTVPSWLFTALVHCRSRMSQFRVLDRKSVV